MADQTQVFASPMTGSASGTGISPSVNGSGSFVPKLSEALANMDTELMHQIVTRECSTVFVKKIDEFLSFLNRLTSGNKSIMAGVISDPNVAQKMEALRAGMQSLNKTE